MANVYADMEVLTYLIEKTFDRTLDPLLVEAVSGEYTTYAIHMTGAVLSSDKLMEVHLLPDVRKTFDLIHAEICNEDTRTRDNLLWGGPNEGDKKYPILSAFKAFDSEARDLWKQEIGAPTSTVNIFQDRTIDSIVKNHRLYKDLGGQFGRIVRGDAESIFRMVAEGFDFASDAAYADKEYWMKIMDIYFRFQKKLDAYPETKASS